ncbi:MAG: agmatine deiminase family protein [Bacteroides sp.]|nr:agmatine deiminase family protein [Bacteroides sp.]
MGIIVGLPRTGGSEKELQLDFGQVVHQQEEVRAPFLPAEWYPQSGVQLTWPHAATDWGHMLEEAEVCFTEIAREIACREQLLIVTPEPQRVAARIAPVVRMENVTFFRCDTNDTWARDHGAITLMDTDGPSLLDFTFNGWGLKFASDRDNRITRRAFEAGHIQGRYVNRLGFVLEGGSVESDGMGTLLTTSECLLSPNRNGEMNRVEIETYLRSVFHLQRVLWLDHGYLAGDDTDSHIDTLARFCSPDTIAYVQCTDPEDEHYGSLARMEKQLQEFRTSEGKPYRLLVLPMADAIREEGERLPATYANFLILNGAILYPTYRQPHNDRKAGEVLQEAFPDREIVGIDCCPLIRQHGSLHCVTMQYPRGVIPVLPGAEDSHVR